MNGWGKVQALQMNVHDRSPEYKRDGALVKLAGLSRSEILKPYLAQRLTATGTVLDLSIMSTALLDERGQMYAIATTERAKSGYVPGEPV
jgi:two-component system CheB/CheR fusion protein